MAIKIQLIPRSEFERVERLAPAQNDRLGLLADMCRANTLATIQAAGSGHVGSSFSSLDIVTLLYYHELNIRELGIAHPDRDVYFSSKGHDVPGLYALLFALGILPEERFIALRRLNGTCGHPDVSIPGCEASSGSLGMGISKAKGMAWAKRHLGRGGRVFVMTGDGELQEGQVYEALQNAVQQGVSNLHVIVDHNKVQSERLVRDQSDLGDIEDRLRCFGWHVARCDGHDFGQLAATFSEFRKITDKPKALVADTIKGRGVSFMEHPIALAQNSGTYPWHSGAPDEESFVAAFNEIISRVNQRLGSLGLDPVRFEDLLHQPATQPSAATESVADAFGEALVEIGHRRTDLVVLDADLAADCRLTAFRERFPQHFIECGIAEQDMVSTAGGLALQGLLPVVNSFAAFLSSRANEQIYANACERTKIIYVNHYAGLLPAAAGMSHQSVRDASLLAALPNVTIIQPCNVAETRMALAYAVDHARASCCIRLFLGPSPRVVELPDGYRLRPGVGVILRDGRDFAIVTYGPPMMSEALATAERLSQHDLHAAVVNMPWLNRVDHEWLRQLALRFSNLVVLEDHAAIGALADALMRGLTALKLNDKCHVRVFAVEGFPAWGTNKEVLRFHGLDSESIANALLADAER